MYRASISNRHFYQLIDFAVFYNSNWFDRYWRKIRDVSNDKIRKEKEKERGSQLRRHVANCRAAFWKGTVHGDGGASAKDEAAERRMYVAAVRRDDSMRGGRQRRSVICDSKRAIHLTTCQDSIGGICLWNQSRRTSLSVVPRFSSFSLLLDCLSAGKIRRTKVREWKMPDLLYRNWRARNDPDPR